MKAIGWPEVDHHVGVEDGQLVCPRCGETYGVHVDEVSVAARPKGEDGCEAFIRINAKGVMTLGDETPGLTGRRHRIALRVWCELCGCDDWLVLMQHKGATEISIEPNP